MYKIYFYLFLTIFLGHGLYSQEYLEGEILVKFKETTSTLSQRKAVISSLGASSFKKSEGSEYVKIKLKQGDTVEDAIKRYAGNAEVDVVQPNFVYRLFSTVPNDSYYNSLWGLKNIGQNVSVECATYGNNPGTSGDDINVELAWDKITDCGSIVVAIIDTGVNYKHRELVANMWDGGSTYPNHGKDFADSDNDPMDVNGHGTHVAGIIGAVGNNAQDGTGVCWKANIMALRAFDIDGTATSDKLTSALDFAITNSAKIVNMSFGINGYDSAFAEKVNQAEAANVLVVTASGNENSNVDGSSSVYPCALTNSNVLCVTALDQQYQLASFANYGATSVDVGAPGANIYSSWFGDTVINDSLVAGSWATCAVPAECSGGSSWATKTTSYCGVANTNILVIPATWDGSSVSYTAGTSRYVYKQFTDAGLATASPVVLSFGAAVDTAVADRFIINSHASADPFGGGGLQLDSISTQDSPTAISSEKYLVTNCGSPSNTCWIGLKLNSTGGTGRGVAVVDFRLYGVHDNTSEYKIEHGTSMSAPYAAGLAALLMSYNSGFTANDARGAIIGGGRATSSLSGKTTSGNAIDAWGALTYVNAPIGVTATAQ